MAKKKTTGKSAKKPAVKKSSGKKATSPGLVNIQRIGKALVKLGTALQGSAKADGSLDSIAQAMSRVTAFDNSRPDKESFPALLRDRLEIEDTDYQKIGPKLPATLAAVLEALVEYRDRLQQD